LSNRIFYDVTIWEEIRSTVSRKTGLFVENISKEIPKDRSLAEFQGKEPISFQLREVMEQRAEAWVRHVYDTCCDAYKNCGKAVSEDFDRAVWMYCIEPFIMGQKEADIHSETMNGFLELLLCAVGSPREKRRFLTVSQRNRCLQVRKNVFDTWKARLHHRPSRMDEAAAAMARYNEVEARARHIVAGLTPEPPQGPNLTPPSTNVTSEQPQISETTTTAAVPSSLPVVGQKLPKQQHPPLPPRVNDYSNLLDPAGLTELQRECFSLRHEYQLPVAEIARRLGRDRKTIQEHLDAAENKTKSALSKERAGKRLARFGLDEESLGPKA
jgi:predicted DNA-binding protein (UPF0251 family)